MSTVPPAIQEAADEAMKIRNEVLGTNPPPGPKADLDQQRATLEAEVKALEAKKTELTKDINTLNGSYGARLQRLNTQLQESDRQIFALKQENDRLKTELAKALESPGKPAEPMTDDKLKEIYGEDFLREYGSEVAIALEKRLASETTALKAKIAELESRKPDAPPAPAADDAEAKRANAERFWNAVEVHIPNAREMNDTDKGWLTFLNETDPATGKPRLEAGQQAIQRGDIQAVVDLYRAYIAVRDGASADRKPKVESQVDPAGVKAGSGDPAGGTKTLSMADWDAFAAEVRQYPRKYSIEEVNRRNDEFRQALLEGRLKQ